MRKIIVSTIVFMLLGLRLAANAGEDDGRFRYDDQNRTDRQELLSPEERQHYRQKLWELKTEAERERFRDAQRQMLEKRARDLGMPDGFEAYGEGKISKMPEKERQWPDDGLRRWPEARVANDGLRRWSGKHPLAAKDRREEPSRRWPARERESQRKGSDPKEGKP